MKQRAAAVAGNKRFAPRSGTRTPAVFTTEMSASAIPCHIVDISTTGAKIAVSGSVLRNLTGEVKTLQLIEKLSRVRYDCKVIWATETELGLKFTAQPILPPPLPRKRR